MTDLVHKAQTKVVDLLTQELSSDYLYHNLRHTRRVVNSVMEITESMELSDQDREKLILAAWFHDTGFTKGHQEHEEKSCQIAQDFLSGQKVDEAFIKEVCALIMATKMDHETKTPLEEVIKDADTAHMADKNYIAISEMLREELEGLGIRSYSMEEWRSKNIEMFRTEHYYHTDYAKDNWQKGKDKNLKRLVKAKRKEREIEKKASLKSKYKDLSPDRGVQTLYRTTLRNHIKLSDIADTKSNILLSVNAIIISLALSNLIPKLDNPSNDYLIVPTAVFIVFSIIAMILSIVATRPNVTRGTFTQEDVDQKRVNLLFFGNFHKMKLSDYEAAMETMIADKEYIYSSLTKDLYYLGVVLERKYRILRWTYTVFMVGMILSVIAFGIAFKFYGPERIMEVM